MEAITLEAQVRNSDENVRAIRKAKSVPCVVYGNTENTLLKVDAQALLKTYIKAGESTVVELKVDGGKALPVLFHAIDIDPLSDALSHVDFLALDMNKEVTTHVALRAIGESPAIKSLGGVLVTVMSELTVTCLPKNLPHGFDVSIEKLAEFGDAVTVADIAVPQGVTIDADPAQILFMVQEPRKEVEPEPVAAEGAPVEGEGAAPAAEGAAPAEAPAKE